MQCSFLVTGVSGPSWLFQTCIQWFSEQPKASSWGREDMKMMVWFFTIFICVVRKIY